MMKKGIITIAMALLSAVLLLFAAGIAHQSSMRKETAYGLQTIDSARQHYDSAASAIGAMARREAANITIAGNNISMRTNLTSLAAYPRDLRRLRSFIYEKADSNITLDISEADNPTLYIRPQGITMSYTANKLAITPQNTPTSAGNLTGYAITLTFNQPTPAFYWASITPGSANNTSSIFVQVAAIGTNGTVSNSTYIDRYSASQLRLLNPSNQSMATLRFSPPSALQVNYDPAYATYLEANLALGQTPYAELGTTLINVSEDVNLIGPVVFR